MLRNYTLSQGHCLALASAISLIDNKRINRIFLDNNGVTGKQFAEILRGLQSVPDLKSVCYRQNQLTQESIQALRPFFLRWVPYQLQELRLVDVKISPQNCEALIEALSLRESDLSKLALVNCNQTDRSFEKLIRYIAKNKTLRELDLSWCEVRPTQFQKLFQVLASNRQLTHLTLEYDCVLVEEKQ